MNRCPDCNSASLENISNFNEYREARSSDPAFAIYYCHFCTYQSFPSQPADASSSVTSPRPEPSKLDLIRSIRLRVASLDTEKPPSTDKQVTVLDERTIYKTTGLLRSRKRTTQRVTIASGWRLAEVRTRTSRSRWDDSYPVDDVLGVILEPTAQLSAYQYISHNLKGSPEPVVSVRLDDEHQQSLFVQGIDLRRLHNDRGLSNAAGCRLYRSVDIGLQDLEKGLARLGL